MSHLDDLVSVIISTQTQSISRVGFGQPLIAASKVPFGGALIREYSLVSEMVTDGFLVTDPAAVKAAAFLAQNPKVTSFKVGRRDTPHTQDVDFVPTDTAEFAVYNIDVISPLGITTNVAFTNGGAETVATIVAALQALLDAVTGVTATDNTTSVSVAVDAPGDMAAYINLTANLTYDDVTPDPGLAADLAAIRAEDNDWYGLIIDSSGAAEIAAAAAFAETELMLFGYESGDSDIKVAGSSDIMSTLQTSGFARAFGLFHADARAGAGAAWMGKQFPKTPGSTTWAYKELAGIAVSKLSTSELGFIEAKAGNHYTRLAGANITQDGRTAADEFIDITRFVDSLSSGLQEDVFAALVANDKVPFTDPGVGAFVGVVKGRLGLSVGSGLAADPAPVVTAPRVKDVSSADKIARTLPDVNFAATLEGAIHKLRITGVLSV